jgi:alkylhydroperoxidase family enzyme
LTVYSAIGQIAGLSKEEIRDSRQGISPNTKVAEALRFAKQIVENRGQVEREDIGRLRHVGYSETEIVEIIANVSLTIFTNYLNMVAQTTIDYPEDIAISTAPVKEVEGKFDRT